MSKPNDAWWMYRVVGVTPVSVRPRSPLTTSLLGDANLITRDAASALISRNAVARAADDKRRRLIEQWAAMFFDGKGGTFDSVLLVRGTMPHPESREEAGRASRLGRARELAALLNFAVLWDTRNRHAVALVDRLPRASSVELAFDMAGNMRLGLKYNRADSTPPFVVSAHKIARPRLRQILRKRPMAALAKTLISTKRDDDGDLARAVRQAALHFSESIVSPTLEHRLLGCVTAIEILFGGGSYDRLKRRLYALVGRMLYRRYNVEDVFKARNNYTHGGHEVIANTVQRAIALAQVAVVMVADLFRIFGSRRQLCEYLDVVAAADVAISTCPPGHRKRLKSVLRHRRF